MQSFGFSFVLAIFSLVPPASHAQPPLTPEQEAQAQERKNNADLDKRMKEMSELENMRRSPNPPKQSRKEKEAEKEAYEKLLQLRQVTPEDLAKYKALLQSGTGGLFRPIPDHDCVTNYLVRTDGPCAGFMDGASAYSFRFNKYFENAGGYLSQYQNADIRFNRNLLTSKGFLEHGIIVELGDIPLETVDLTNPGLKFLVEFKPAATRQEARVFEAQLDKKISSANYVYSNSVNPSENITYAMRIIAYKIRGVDLSGNLTAEGYKFFWLRYDARADLTIVFRIVRTDTDGTLTILWKGLQRKKGPTIKF